MATAIPSDHYNVLGVAPDADAAAIKTAYRKLVLKCHPDKVSDPALKEQKQDEFQKVQESYETLSDPDKRSKYDLELRARELREERDRARPRAAPASSTRTANVRVPTNPEFRTPHSSPPKMTSYKSYSGSTEYKARDPIFAYRPKHSYEPETRSRRSASDEKLRRDDYRDSREARRKEEERDELRRREMRREYERMKAAKERDDRDAREALRRAEKKASQRDKERRRADDAEKAKSKSRSPYVEHYTEEAEDRKSRKTRSPRKDSASARDKSSSKLRDRSSAREEVPPSVPPALPAQGDAMKSKLDYAASYISSKTRLPKHGPEVSVFSQPFPDPDISWTPPQRRTSGEARHLHPEPVEVIDGTIPSRGNFEAPPTQAHPPPLQKMHTAPPGQMYQTEVPHLPKRATLSRAQTMDPEYLARDRYKASRRGRSSFDESHDDYYMDTNYFPKVQKYTVRRGENQVPRVSAPYYGEPTSGPSSHSFGKVKTSTQYRAEHVERTRSYNMKDAATMDYQPMFSASGGANAAVYGQA